jgi:hypothetical protein
MASIWHASKAILADMSKWENMCHARPQVIYYIRKVAFMALIHKADLQLCSCFVKDLLCFMDIHYLVPGSGAVPKLRRNVPQSKTFKIKKSTLWTATRI